MIAIIAVLMGFSFIIGVLFEKNNLTIRITRRFTDSPIEEGNQYFVSAEKLISSKPLTNDPLSKYQWNLRVLLDGIEYAEISRNAMRSVIVAVIDESVNVDHPDLINRMIQGYDFVDGDEDTSIPYDNTAPNASISHGQAAASIIAAEANNGIGIAGVFSRALIMPIRTGLSSLHKGIKYAVDHGAEVIHLSGGVGPSQILNPTYLAKKRGKPHASLYSQKNLSVLRNLESALNYAYMKNVVVISGVGNTGKWENYYFPSDHRTIAVGPHNVNGEISQHSSYSYVFDIFAPGGSRKHLENEESLKDNFPDNILTYGRGANFDDPLCAIGDSSYSFLTLGSGALPHVSGASAIIKSCIPNITVEEVRSILRKSQIPLSASGNIMEGIAGRLSLRIMLAEITKRRSREERL